MPDMYLKIQSDPGFIENKIEVVDLLEQYLQQIEMILFTRKGDVLGDFTFGADIEDLIYELNLSESAIKYAIWDQIKRYCPLHNIFKTEININFYRGTERDIAVIDIIINNNLVSGIIIS